MSTTTLRITILSALSFFILIGTTAPVSAAIWYVNDTSTTGDSFTQAVGYDTNDGTTPSTPKRTVNSIDSLLTAGDTVFIDAGFYYESDTISIDTNGIFLVGVDSASTVIRFDAATSSALRTIRCSNVVDLVFRDFRVQNGYIGVWWTNVDSSKIERVTSDTHGANGIRLDSAGSSGSESNFISGSAGTDNSSYGIYVINGSNNNIYLNSFSNNANTGGYFQATSNNTLHSNTVSQNNGVGLYLISSESNTVTGNTVSGNSSYGINLLNASNSNLVSSNIASANVEFGFYLYSSDDNRLVNNASTANGSDGIYLFSSRGSSVTGNVVSSNFSSGIRTDSTVNSLITQNTFDSNANWAFLIDSGSYSAADTVTKNVFLVSPYADFADSVLYNNSASNFQFDFTRNWWGATDTAAIFRKIHGQAFDSRTKINYDSFRLGIVDTAAGIDTVAPNAPDTLAIDTRGSTWAILSWDTSSGSEEPESSVTLGGHRLYRANRVDTSYWAFLASISPGIDTYLDTGLSTSESYFYRVTAFDAKTPFPNESFYSDSIPSVSPTIFTSAPNVWYVNDASTSGDSFSQAVGSDGNDGVQPTKPKRTLAGLSALLSAGDTVYLDAGTYSADSLVILVDTIWVVGKDSSSTILDLGDSLTASAIGISATGRIGLRVYGLQIQNAFQGVSFSNVDNSVIDSVSVRHTGSTGFSFGTGSSGVEISHSETLRTVGSAISLVAAVNCTVARNVFRDGDSSGIELSGATSNFIDSNLVDSMSKMGVTLGSASTSNWFSNNTVRNSGQRGFELNSGNSACTFVNNSADSSGSDGFWIQSSNNLLSCNAARFNMLAGFRFASSSGNQLDHSFADSNGLAGLLFEGTASSDTVTKMTILPTPGDTNYLINTTSNAFSVTKSWWNATDSKVIEGLIGGAGGKLVNYVPFRLGIIDTTCGADTVAPNAPDTVAIDTVSATSLRIKWQASSGSEESEASANVGGYNIYRSLVADTTVWLLVGTADSISHTFTDSGLLAATPYFYRVAAFDTSSYPNFSYYSDSIASETPTGPTDTSLINVWYVNDSSTTGDSFTTAIGYDTNSGLSPSSPKRTLAEISKRLTPGDTVYLDAGTYYETLPILTDTVFFVGKDSASTIIDPGDSTTATVAGVSAVGKSGFEVWNLRVQNAYDGIRMSGGRKTVAGSINVQFTGRSGFLLDSGAKEIDIRTSHTSRTGGAAVHLDSGGGCTITNSLFQNGSGIGFDLDSSPGNHISGNTIDSMSLTGVTVSGPSINNWFLNNTVRNNGQGAWLIEAGGNSCTFVGNTADTHGGRGFSVMSANNYFSNNFARNNSLAGMYFLSSSGNRIIHSYVVSNSSSEGGIYFQGTTSNNTVEKTTIIPKSGDTSHVLNGTDTPVTFTRSWWGTRDTLQIEGFFVGGGKNKIIYSPFRLGEIDTAAGSDTVAPNAPDTVAASRQGDSAILVTWATSSGSEESEAAANLSGYKIYRARSTKDTSFWVLAGSTPAGTTSFVDSGHGAGETFFYRVTAFDTKTPYVNESYYSDSIPSAFTDSGMPIDTTVANIWYVNDGSSVGDSFTTAAGNDSANGISPSSPKRTLEAVEGLLTPGDSVYIDAGTFAMTDTFRISISSVSFVGVDSSATILDFDNTTSDSDYGVYAESVASITISDLGITRAYNAIRFNNVDSSVISRVQAYGNGFRAIYFINASDNDQISSSLIRDNMSTGIYLTSSDRTTITGNRIASNAGTGVILDSSVNSFVSRNVIFNNGGAGVQSANLSRSNSVFQNTFDSNLMWAMNFTQFAIGDTFTKNNFKPSTANPDSWLQNLTSNRPVIARNWWGTTDSAAIFSRITGTGASFLVFAPFRLGAVDTGLNADTIAPRAPQSVTASSVDSTNIIIRWSASAGSEETEPAANVAGYRVYRSRIADTSYWIPIAQVAAPGDSAIDTSVLLFETWYYRVTAFDTVTPHDNESFFSDSTAAAQAGFETDSPLAFGLLTPESGTETTVTTILFSWDTAVDTNPVLYRLIVDTDFLGTSLVDSTITGNTYAAVLPANDTYQWRVIVTDTWGNSRTIGDSSFAIDTMGPLFELVAPNNALNTSAFTFNFSWSAATDSIAGIQKYELQIDTSGTWTASIVDFFIFGATDTTVTLHANDTFYWRVIAFDELSNTTVSPVRTIVVDTRISVTLVSPSAGVTTDSRPIFTWSGTSLDTYLWQISSDSLFSTIKEDRLWFNGETSNQSVSLESGLYYWRVSAYDHFGNSETTGARDIRVDTALSDTEPPAAFSLLAPADNTETRSTTITFSWNATTDGGSGLQNYSLQIDTAGIFASLYSQDTVTAVTTTLAKTLVGTETFFWRVIASDQAGNTTATSSRKIIIDTTPPAAASLLSPATAIETSSLVISFTWSGAVDVHSSIKDHRLQASTSSAFTSLLFDSSTGVNTAGKLVLYGSETFHWRVIATDNAGNTAVSASRFVVIDTTSPGPSTLVSPLDGIETRLTSLLFNWTPSADSTSHRIQLSTSGVFAVLTIDSSTGSSTSALLTLASDTHYWRIVSQDALGNTVISASRFFVIDTQAPAGASLASPTDFFESRITSVTFTWGAAAGAVSYRLQVCTSTAFVFLIVDSSTAATTLTPGSFASDTYHWRVISQDNSGNTTVSDSRGFLIDTAPPFPGAPASPVGGVETSVTSIRFRWSAGSDTLTGVSAYRLQISLDSAFASPIYDVIPSGTEAETTPNYLFATYGTYYWRIAARDRVGNWDTSSVAHFTRPTPTDLVAPVAISNLVATSNSDATITICWLKSPSTDMPGGGQYNLYWDNATGTISETSAPLAVVVHNNSDTRYCFTTAVLQSGRLYSFTVRAQDRNGNQNSDSTKVSAWSFAGAAPTPHAVIAQPRAGLKVLRQVVLISADISPETDINSVASVRFQYRADTTNNDAPWSNMGALTSTHPNPAVDSSGKRFKIQWDMKGTRAGNDTVPSGVYQLRAVAVTKAGVTDSMPSVVVVEIVTGAAEADRRDTRMSDGRVKTEEKIHKGRENVVTAAEDVTTVDLTLPEGILTGDTDTVTLTIDPNSGDAAPPGRSAMSGLVDISLASGQTTFGGNRVKVRISYDDTDDNGVIDGTSQNVSELEMWTFSNSVWELGTNRIIDTTAKTIQSEFSHFSVFLLVGAGVAHNDLNRFSVYPNPYVPNDGDLNTGANFNGAANSGITFINLPQKIRIRIFTVTGKKVFEFATESSTGAVQWDTRNEENRLVASGIYYFVIDDRITGQIVSGKLAIVR